ncbi:MAG: nitroreductase/quinone reductase family protein [Acidimicrobiales bacterium]
MRRCAIASYRRPGWFTVHVLNGVVVLAARLGVSLRGTRALRVRGRATKAWRTVPVHLLVLDGERYLVAVRGETEWVRNIRVAGEGELVIGRRVEPFVVEEIADPDKAEILRAYLRRWGAEVAASFDGVKAESPEDELRRIAPQHPVFKIVVPRR